LEFFAAKLQLSLQKFAARQGWKFFKLMGMRTGKKLGFSKKCLNPNVMY